MNTMCLNTKWFNEKEGALDLDFIRANEVVKSRGTKHCPISSATILEQFRSRATELGLTLVNEKAGLLRQSVDKKGEIKGGDRFMYVAEVKDEVRPDYSLSIGFRNFGDKSLAFSGMLANRIFVCQNGVCTGIVKDSKTRHTIGNMGNSASLLNSRIDTIFARFLADKDAMHGQIAKMKGTKLTDEIVGKFIKSAHGKWEANKNGEMAFAPNQFIGSTNLLRILEELEKPTLNDNDDNSLFRLMNACSYVTTHKIKNPNQSVMASRYCNNLIMSIIDDKFIPLGDVVDVEDETEE